LVILNVYGINVYKRGNYKDIILIGFADSTVNRLASYERLEKKLDEYKGNLKKAALETMMIVGNKDVLLVLSVNIDIIEPNDNIAAIVSGGPYAYAATKALYYNTNVNAYEIVKKPMEIAASICIYTNSFFSIDYLEF